MPVVEGSHQTGMYKHSRDNGSESIWWKCSSYEVPNETSFREYDILFAFIENACLRCSTNNFFFTAMYSEEDEVVKSVMYRNSEDPHKKLSEVNTGSLVDPRIKIQPPEVCYGLTIFSFCWWSFCLSPHKTWAIAVDFSPRKGVIPTRLFVWVWIF